MEGWRILILVIFFILLVVIVCTREEEERCVPVGRVRINTFDDKYAIVPGAESVQVVKAKHYRGELWNCNKDDVNKAHILSTNETTLGHKLHNLILTCEPEKMALVKFIKPYKKKALYHIQINDRYVTIIDGRTYITTDRKQAKLFKVTAA